MGNHMLPTSYSLKLPALPSLIAMVSKPGLTAEQEDCARLAVSHLENLYHLRTASLAADMSLPLKQCGPLAKAENGPAMVSLRGSGSQRTVKAIDSQLDDTTFLALIKESRVPDISPSNGGYVQWNWNCIVELTKVGHHLDGKRLDGIFAKTFIRRLLVFYRPSSRLFSSIVIDTEHADMYCMVGQQLFQLLVGVQDAAKLLGAGDLLKDLGDNLANPIGVFSRQSLAGTLSQCYFVFLGDMLSVCSGVELLQEHRAVHHLYQLCDMVERPDIMRLILHYFDFLSPGHAQVLAGTLLTSPHQTVRQLALSEIQPLLSATAVRRNPWVVRMLVDQLYDPSAAVAKKALAVLLDVSDDAVALELIVAQHPALLHFGDAGVELLTRFLTLSTGFCFLNSRNFISDELYGWRRHKAKDYARRVEDLLVLSLTNHSKLQQQECHSESNIPLVNSLDAAKIGQLQIPIHFYGELCRLPEGAALLEKDMVVDELCGIVRRAHTVDGSGGKLLALKAALWSLGHIGSTVYGMRLLPPDFMEIVVDLTTTAPMFSIVG